MKLFLFSFLLLCSGILPAQSNGFSAPDFYDGPYLFFHEEGLLARWAYQGEMRERLLRPGERLELEAEVSPSFDPRYLDAGHAIEPDTQVSFQGVGKLAAISDIHGQYDLMVRLLQVHGIADASNDWIFGDGHLVVVGDIFDRGEGVTDILWLVHKLEKQAQQAGGRVHYLLGNHEAMVLMSDLRYVNKKYRYTTAVLRTPYSQLFGPESYMGQWIRSKPIAISINDIAFVHAGFSEACLDLGLSFAEINAAFRERIFDHDEEAILTDPTLSVLYGEAGPLWYRGYFQEGYKKGRASRILKRLGKKHIVVGHTPFPQIISLFKRKIIGVDSTIQLGQKGELFWYEEGEFFRGLHTGQKIKLR
jgi:hypothetical protein